MSERSILSKIGIVWIWIVLLLAGGAGGFIALGIYSTGDTIGLPWFLIYLAVIAGIVILPGVILLVVGSLMPNRKG